jgi:hypothetical protein
MKIKFKRAGSEIIFIDGQTFPINPGDQWPLPFRGLRLTIRSKQGDPTLCFKFRDFLLSTKWPPGLLAGIQAVKKPPLGSFRITAHGHVITKVYEGPEHWVPYYVGKINGVPEFEGFCHQANGLEPGSFWTGFYSKGGENWSVLDRKNSGDYLHWSRHGTYIASTREYPELCKLFRSIRTTGGRLVVVPGGEIWMNLPPAKTSDEWRSKIMTRLSADHVKFMSSKIWNNLVLLLDERVKATKVYPIYIGHIKDFDHAELPWSSIRVEDLFGKATPLEDDEDEDAFTAVGWKRMRS